MKYKREYHCVFYLATYLKRMWFHLDPQVFYSLHVKSEFTLPVSTDDDAETNETTHGSGLTSVEPVGI